MTMSRDAWKRSLVLVTNDAPVDVVDAREPRPNAGIDWPVIASIVQRRNEREADAIRLNSQDGRRYRAMFMRFAEQRQAEPGVKETTMESLMVVATEYVEEGRRLHERLAGKPPGSEDGPLARRPSSDMLKGS